MGTLKIDEMRLLDAWHDMKMPTVVSPRPRPDWMANTMQGMAGLLSITLQL